MISVVIFTLNEEVNLPHCLASLCSCDDIVVIDSYSTDRTCEMARQSGARVFQHFFTGFGDQRMWALEHITFKYPWVLVLDADERVTLSLWKEMFHQVKFCSNHTVAFRLKRRFHWKGIWLRHANLYPSWVLRLVRVGKVKYENRGHAEIHQVDGQIGSLEEDLIDENHKGMTEWRERQTRYAEEEARYEVLSNKKLHLIDLLSKNPFLRQTALKEMGRRLPLRGLCYFVYSYLFRSGWKDGWIGFQFCLEKARFQSKIKCYGYYLRSHFWGM